MLPNIRYIETDREEISNYRIKIMKATDTLRLHMWPSGGWRGQYKTFGFVKFDGF